MRARLIAMAVAVLAVLGLIAWLCVLDARLDASKAREAALVEANAHAQSALEAVQADRARVISTLEAVQADEKNRMAKVTAQKADIARAPAADDGAVAPILRQTLEGFK